MLRHITLGSHFIEMKKDGYLRPMKNSSVLAPEKNIVAFEKAWIGDAYFKVMYIAKNATPNISFSPTDMIALIFDEQDLLVKGYQILDSTESEGKEKKIKLEPMLSRGELSQNEYEEVGEFIFVIGEIPLNYMVNVDIPNKARLNRLGLI